jgi:hypothetical protein
MRAMTQNQVVRNRREVPFLELSSVSRGTNETNGIEPCTVDKIDKIDKIFELIEPYRTMLHETMEYVTAFC